ncbi:FAD dependent oxidoreductase [Desulfotomaculum nigrificans CO-1-SRB]|uniref:FAD dependent oxidoreductase n=1 Tax=Desulfotomaculum nigrificans (strain DSM 14880 / VKM B-2319 / CO-1-SRB) TaxID=868595 RepID=F6B8W0_DESCC|nr:NAD(P)/FAD-dependent oxidoreductase [Desulfotomaculum nigrificans]AEF94803.1 FAD dependent oxidoreductase [Desulfotomaculum nigrificans CO-1-SRB]
MIKVAIIGAGIAGLSCAIELEKLGIKPAIFEQKHRVGSPFTFAPMTLNFSFKPIKDQLKELKKRYDIDIKPISKIKLLRVQGPNSEYMVQGHLGYTVLRGQEEQSAECQLARILKTPIKFECPVKPEDLLKKFDYLVIADGTGHWAKKLNIWQSLFKCWIRGATVLGRFNPREVRIWINTNYCKSGFVYLVPLSTDRASLILIASYITHGQLDHYWQTFIEQEKIFPEMINKWDMEFETGLVYPHRVGNTFFIGNSGGFVTSWIGMGLFSCVASGVEAARAIAGQGDYEKSMKFHQAVMEANATMRRLWDRLNNRNIDRFIRIIGTPPLKQVFYQSNLNLIEKTSPLLSQLLKTSEEVQYFQ